MIQRLAMIALAAVLLTSCTDANKPETAADTEPSLPSPAREKLDRGLIALKRGDGSVYIGWRLFNEDPGGLAFDVYRKTPAGQAEKLATVNATTDYVDAPPPGFKTLDYWVTARAAGYAAADSQRATVDMTAEAREYLRVPLAENIRGFMQPSVADLDGDGDLDFVIKTPDSYLDPGGSGWHYDSRTYKLHAYTRGGKALWTSDLGPAIEPGTWYSPVLVYDFDGDGKAEVVTKTGPTINDPTFEPRRDKPKGHVIDEREFVSVLDGTTGQIAAQAEWPARQGYEKYSLASRNLLGLAYLDGERPAIIVARGTYGLIRIDAYRYHDQKLQRLWRWENTQQAEAGYHGDGSRNGPGSHFMHAADVDGDGRDEVIYGSFVLDDDGKGLWAMTRTEQGRKSPGGHPDMHYVGDILPSRPGLEIFYGYEKWHEKNGACLVDAKTGELIWGTDAKTGHFHKAGLCSDIDAAHPGMECYGKDMELSKKDDPHTWLWAADGTVLKHGGAIDWGQQAMAAYWDADLQREVILANKLTNYPAGDTVMEMTGAERTILVADILGDWREEIIRSTSAHELRIYTTTIPANDRRPTLLQDPIYRIDVANSAMGYGQTPMVTRCLEAE